MPATYAIPPATRQFDQVPAGGSETAGLTTRVISLIGFAPRWEAELSLVRSRPKGRRADPGLTALPRPSHDPGAPIAGLASIVEKTMMPVEYDVTGKVVFI